MTLSLQPSQWETSLHINTVSHWLAANLESALIEDYETFSRKKSPEWWPVVGSSDYTAGQEKVIYFVIFRAMWKKFVEIDFKIWMRPKQNLRRIWKFVLEKGPNMCRCMMWPHYDKRCALNTGSKAFTFLSSHAKHIFLTR